MQADQTTQDTPTDEPDSQSTFKADFMASLVVFLVALPLCIGIAVAVGVSPARALITGIVGGLFVGIFAGSPLQVSGPAAGLFVIVAELLRDSRAQFEETSSLTGRALEAAADTHSLIVLGVCVFLAGVLQIVAGRLRLGQWFRAVSPAVIKGMLAGIGILILISQFHVMLDHKAMWHGEKARGAFQYIATMPEAIVKCFSSDDGGAGFTISGSSGAGEDGSAGTFTAVLNHEPASDVVITVSSGDTGQATVNVPSLTFTPANWDTAQTVTVTRAGDDDDGSTTITVAIDRANSDDRYDPLPDQTVSVAIENGQLAVSPIVIPTNHHLAALTGIIAIVCFVGWPLVAPKKLKFLPAALLGIVVATVFATITDLDVQKLTVPDNMFAEMTYPSASWSKLLLEPTVFVSAVVIALVASAETLLCATAVDQMHQGPRTKYDQELTAQGVGNVVCGLVGALPMTGVIVRSSANVASGAKTRASTIMHGLWLLIFVAAIPFVLTYIPRSALGALLVYTGFKLVKIDDIKSLWKTSRGEAGIYFATVGTIVATDLLKGVILGIVLSAVKLLVRFSNLEIKLEEGNDGQANLYLIGAATFVSLPKLAGHLEEVPAGAKLVVHFEDLNYIDHACLDLLMNWARQHSNLGGQLILDWEELQGRFGPESPDAAKRTV